MTKQDKVPVADKPRVVGTNPLELPWPRDPSGVTYKVQSAGTAAVSHINGGRETLDAFLETLEILRLHAIESFREQVNYKRSLISKAVKRSQVEAEFREATRQRTIAALKAQIETLGGDPEAKETDNA